MASANHSMSRVGVVFPGDPARSDTWSGTPRGVIDGLARIGVEPIAVRAQPRSALARAGALNLVSLMYLRPGRDLNSAARRARRAARASPQMSTVDSWATPGALRRAAPLDGIIQIGTGYSLRTSIPVATFEDMTVLQVKTHPYLGWDLLSSRQFEARLDYQRRAYDRATACCFTSDWAAESAIRDYGVPAEKVHAVGVGRNHTAPNLGERDWAAPRFLFVGMDWPRKNGDGVVRAFTHLRAEVPAARLDLVGGHPQIDVSGVTGHGVLRLDVPEQRSELERLFGEATCFVMPSHAEASSIAYVEAASAGLPVIGTSQGGSEFLIGDGGLIVDPSDDGAIFDAMRKLCDPESARLMGSRARERSELFTWEAVARRLVRALCGQPAERLAVEAAGHALGR